MKPILNLKKIELNKIYNMNCIDGMKLIPKNKIDLIITDPPFAINFKAKKANYNRKAELVLDGYSDIKPEDYAKFSESWIAECFRILKDDGSIYIFSGYNHGAEYTIVNGKIAVEQGRLTGFDETEIMNKCNAISDKMIKQEGN